MWKKVSATVGSLIAIATLIGIVRTYDDRYAKADNFHRLTVKVEAKAEQEDLEILAQRFDRKVLEDQRFYLQQRLYSKQDRINDLDAFYTGSNAEKVILEREIEELKRQIADVDRQLGR